MAASATQTDPAKQVQDLKSYAKVFEDLGKALLSALSPKASAKELLNNLSELQKKTKNNTGALSDYAEMLGLVAGLAKNLFPKIDSKNTGKSKTENGKDKEKDEDKFSLKDRIDKHMKGQAEKADESYEKFLDEKIPGALNKASDAFVNFFSGIAKGAKSSSDLFADLGKSILQTAQGLMDDLLKVGMRFLLFGSDKHGADSFLGKGLLGGLWSAFSSNKDPVNITSNAEYLDWLTCSHGGVFANGSGLSGYRNTVVSSPTLFPFAKGIGLMGEAGAEAIMPLKRMASGELGVRADLEAGNGGASFVQPIIEFNYIDQTSSGVNVQAEPAFANSADPARMIINIVASDISGGGRTASAIRGRFGLQPGRPNAR